MRRIFALAACLFAASSAFAASTIDPNVPSTRGELASAPLRGNFAAAANDINNILGQFAGPNAPINPTIGQYWRKTNVSPQIVYKWSGSAWLQVETFDISGGRSTPYFGNQLLAWQQLLGGLGSAGQCITSNGSGSPPSPQNCVSATTLIASAPLQWNSGALTMSLQYGSDLTVVGGNLALNNVIAAAGPVGSAGSVPVITFDAKGRLTAVTSATITPAAIGAVPTARSISAGSGLTGGCSDLTANCSFALANVISAGGPVGSATQTPVVTYNAFGQITAISAATIAPPFSAVTGQASLAQLPTIGANTVLGSIAGGTPIALSQSQLTALITPCSTTLNGAVPAAGTSTGKVLSDNCTWISVGGTGTVTSVSAGTGMSFPTITGTGSVAVDVASASNIWGGVANKMIDAGGAASGLGLTTLSDNVSGTVAVDMSTGVNFTLSMTAGASNTRQLGNPTNPVVGRCGVIWLVQSATGPNLMTFGSYWKFGSGSAPALATTANAVDFISYCVRATNFIAAALNKDYR